MKPSLWKWSLTKWKKKLFRQATKKFVSHNFFCQATNFFLSRNIFCRATTYFVVRQIFFCRSSLINASIMTLQSLRKPFFQKFSSVDTLAFLLSEHFYDYILKILSEERVSIIVVIVIWIYHFNWARYLRFSLKCASFLPPDDFDI